MATLISQFAGPLLAVLGVLAGIVAAFFAGHSKGQAKAEVKAAEQRSVDNDALASETVKRNQEAVRIQQKTIQDANDEEQAVNNLSDDDLFNELRNPPGIASANERSGKK